MIDQIGSDERASQGDEAAMIADALRQKFSDGAEVVAQLQIEDALGVNQAIWQAVLDRLTK